MSEEDIVAGLQSGGMDVNEREFGNGVGACLLKKALQKGWPGVATAAIAAGATLPADVLYVCRDDHPSGGGSARVLRLLVDLHGVKVNDWAPNTHRSPFFWVVRSAETWLDVDAWRESWEPFATALLERGVSLYFPFQEHPQTLFRCPLSYVNCELKRIRGHRGRVASLEALREVLVRHAAKMHALFIFQKKEPWLLPNAAIEIVLRNM